MKVPTVRYLPRTTARRTVDWTTVWIVEAKQPAILDSRSVRGPTRTRRRGWGDGFNPLDLIDVSSPDAIDDARMIADMMVAVDEGAENVHWNETARAFLAGLALFVKVRRP